VLCTNLASLNKDHLQYLKRHSFNISTSLDGPKFIHDANRRFSGGSSYEVTISKIRMIMSELGKDRVSALMTTTDSSLRYPKEIRIRRARTWAYISAIIATLWPISELLARDRGRSVQ
jgi:sulfatase maturation enzyme AslB (radical SAM superfamily)